jgi:hypothetical protein
MDADGRHAVTLNQFKAQSEARIIHAGFEAKMAQKAHEICVKAFVSHG